MAITTLTFDASATLPTVGATVEPSNLYDPPYSIPQQLKGFSIPVALAKDTFGVAVNFYGGTCAGVNTVSALPFICDNIANFYDLYNFGYYLKIVETNITLSRKSLFTYADELSTYVITLSNSNTGLGRWVLQDSISSVNLVNIGVTPNGSYTGAFNLSAIYVHE